jgi:hypothetical protein
LRTISEGDRCEVRFLAQHQFDAIMDNVKASLFSGIVWAIRTLGVVSLESAITGKVFTASFIGMISSAIVIRIEGKILLSF